MKQKIIFLALLVCCLSTQVKAQDALALNKEYTGAKPTLTVYRVIYQLDSGSPEIIKKAIRNISNLLNDPRLQGKLEVELVAFSGGTEAFKKNSEYEEAIKKLVNQGVKVAQCLNTLKERNIKKSELYDFLAFVPTGNGELVIRSQQGWTVIKP